MGPMEDAGVSDTDPRSAPPSGSLWGVERFVRRHYLAVAALLSTGVVANEVAKVGLAFENWDWLLVSGFTALLAAAYPSLHLPDRVSGTVTRLARRGVLTGPAGLDDVVARLHRAARLVGTGSALLFVVVVVAAFVVAFGDQIGGRLVLLVIECVAAVPVGLFVGRAVVYGRLGRWLARAGGTVVPEPRHLDGAAGLLPVGELYFHQAKLLAVPAAHLAVWWVLIPLFGDRYLRWREPYVGLLAIVVVSAVLAFVLPMLWFHWIMKRARQDLQQEADELSRRASGGSSESDPERYAAIEAMPTWPVDAGIRRRFGAGNVVLLIPVIAQALGASGSSQGMLDGLGKIISGQS